MEAAAHLDDVGLTLADHLEGGVHIVDAHTIDGEEAIVVDQLACRAHAAQAAAVGRESAEKSARKKKRAKVPCV